MVPRLRTGPRLPLVLLHLPDMESVFRQILVDRDQNPIAFSCVIDAIRHGHPMPSLGDLLLAIISDESCAEFLRNDALMAFLNICPG